jgi:hypothetical protein
METGSAIPQPLLREQSGTGFRRRYEPMPLIIRLPDLTTRSTGNRFCFPDSEKVQRCSRDAVIRIDRAETEDAISDAS